MNELFAKCLMEVFDETQDCKEKEWLVLLVRDELFTSILVFFALLPDTLIHLKVTKMTEITIKSER